MPDGFDFALRLLPDTMRKEVEPRCRETAEEFRLRAGRRPTVLQSGGERALQDAPVTAETLREVLDKATGSSYHAVSGELRRGYIAAEGGVRVGVCGTAVTEDGVLALRDISSLSIRIPRQVPGAGRNVMARLGEGSVLILAPPGGGKTTFLRELVRYFSDGGARVSLADERGEIAAVRAGTPQFDVGRSTDVMTGAPKAEAAMVLLRAMNPQIVALDEISDAADAEAAARLAGCGVRVFATAHAPSAAALRERALYRALLRERIFQTAVVITMENGGRRYEAVPL